MSEEARSFAERVGKAVGVPVEMVDERLSSWEANETMNAVHSGKRAGRRPLTDGAAKTDTPLDDIAAAIILRDYLDKNRARTAPRA
jgi:RNase H-fold protein (predicted Holliday junction resolvase)